MILKKNKGKQSNDIDIYLEDQEYIANNYVMKCFTVTIIIYTAALILNFLGIFIIENSLMLKGYIPSLFIYFVVLAVTRYTSMSNQRVKYFILFSIISVYTIAGMFITYHVILVALLPFAYATLYSSKQVMRYVCLLSVISTVLVVYIGYYFGLCDANMALLTIKSLNGYVVGGKFMLTEINSNPALTLMLFFVMPRCLIYIAYMFVCSSIFHVVSGSLEKARLTSELEKAKLEAEKANRAKSRFLAHMSHEIRTPINAILGMNEMIIRESTESNIRDYAYDVKDASVLLLSIINDILDSSKLESGKMEIVAGNYEMGSLLNDLYNMIGIKAKEKGLELVFDIEPTIPAGYFGDDKIIRQILMNLLTNGIKYTDKGKVRLKVTGSADGDNEILHFEVSDTGIGIRQEDIGKLNDEFQRFDMERNKNVEGTGLGMNIVSQFLKLLGSQLTIESEYGKGSSFSFDLVQKIINKNQIGEFRKKSSGANDTRNERKQFFAPEAKVMVVDDNKMNLKVFSNLLKHTQMQIREVESGNECIRILEKERFDLVFLDHMMPGMDGIDTLHAIREQNLCEGVPVIMLTANNIVGERERFIKEGFDDFLSKPIIPAKLEDIILTYLPEHLVLKNEVSVDKTLVQQNEKSLMDRLQENLPEINFEKGMTTCSNDRDFYLELLQDFTSLPIEEELLGYVKNNDYKNYCIKIHSYKNSAYSIGATELGDLAFEMEKLTKEGFSANLWQIQDSFMEKFKNICNSYAQVTGSSN